jgi:hypothetical protein
MSTSSSTNFTLNRNEIVTAALRKLRVVDPNDSANANDITTGAQALNLMIKSWQMDGISMWLNQECVLHLAKDTQSYSIGSTGDNFAALSDCVKTTLTAASAASDTTLTVSSITDIADGDYIGVELDSGSMHWTTVNGSPSGTTVTIDSGVASAAASGNYVFAYTSKVTRPIEILEARLRDTSDNDTVVTVEKSLDEFMAITDKTSTGDCDTIHLIPTITNSKLYTWPVSDDVTKRLVMTVRRVIEDFDSSSDNADLPVECLNAVIWNLAEQLAPEYTRVTPQDVTKWAMVTYDQMKRFYKNRETISFHP